MQSKNNTQLLSLNCTCKMQLYSYKCDTIYILEYCKCAPASPNLHWYALVYHHREDFEFTHLLRKTELHTSMHRYTTSMRNMATRLLWHRFNYRLTLSSHVNVGPPTSLCVLEISLSLSLIRTTNIYFNSVLNKLQHLLQTLRMFFTTKKILFLSVG